MQQAIQHKAEIATTLASSSAAVTWVSQANAIVDLAAGIVAVISGLLAIAWYIKKFRTDHRGRSENGSTPDA